MLRQRSVINKPVLVIYWQYLHMSFIVCYILAAGVLAKLVVAHDCENAGLGWHAEGSAGRPEEEISMGLRWFFCEA